GRCTPILAKSSFGSFWVSGSGRKIETEIKNGRRVCQRADRNQVDAGCCNGTDGVQIDSAGSFGEAPPSDDLDRFGQRCWRHIVEENAIDFLPHHNLELFERVNFDLDPDHMTGGGARRFDGRCNASGRNDVIVLDQYRVEETDTMIVPAATTHGVL